MGFKGRYMLGISGATVLLQRVAMGSNILLVFGTSFTVERVQEIIFCRFLGISMISYGFDRACQIYLVADGFSKCGRIVDCHLSD